MYVYVYIYTCIFNYTHIHRICVWRSGALCARFARRLPQQHGSFPPFLPPSLPPPLSPSLSFLLPLSLPSSLPFPLPSSHSSSLPSSLHCKNDIFWRLVFDGDFFFAKSDLMFIIMYVFTYIYIHTHTYVYVYIYIFIYKYICIQIHMHIYIRLLSCARTHPGYIQRVLKRDVYLCTGCVP